jgi:hypothetical protein
MFYIILDSDFNISIVFIHRSYCPALMVVLGHCLLCIIGFSVWSRGTQSGCAWQSNIFVGSFFNWRKTLCDCCGPDG